LSGSDSLLGPDILGACNGEADLVAMVISEFEEDIDIASQPEQQRLGSSDVDGNVKKTASPRTSWDGEDLSTFWSAVVNGEWVAWNISPAVENSWAGWWSGGDISSISEHSEDGSFVESESLDDSLSDVTVVVHVEDVDGESLGLGQVDSLEVGNWEDDIVDILGQLDLDVSGVTIFVLNLDLEVDDLGNVVVLTSDNIEVGHDFNFGVAADIDGFVGEDTTASPVDGSISNRDGPVLFGSDGFDLASGCGSWPDLQVGW